MGPRVRAGVSGEPTQVIQTTQVACLKFRVPENAANTITASTCSDSRIFPRTLLRVRGDDEAKAVNGGVFKLSCGKVSHATPIISP